MPNERIERVLEICQVFLGERDESATGRRYHLPEGGPARTPRRALPATSWTAPMSSRTRTTEDLLGISGEERLAIMKELEEKK